MTVLSAARIESLNTFCCLAPYKAWGRRSWCSQCRIDTTEDIHCVELYIDTGDIRWLAVFSPVTIYTELAHQHRPVKQETMKNYVFSSARIEATMTWLDQRIQKNLSKMRKRL